MLSQCSVRESLAAPYSGKYLFATFKASIGDNVIPANEQLFLLQSNDGITWGRRPCSYTPTSGHVVRDPSIAYINNVYYLAHTIAYGNCSGFDLAYSVDGFSFHYLTTVDCSDIGGFTANAAVWDPQFFVDTDGSIHIFFEANPDRTVTNNWLMYEKHIVGSLSAPSVPSFSASLRITVAGTDLGAAGPFVVLVGSTYRLFYKADGYTGYSSSSSLVSGYTTTKSGDWAGWGTHLEGGFLISTGVNSWRIYFDQSASLNTYGIVYSDSSDDMATWTALRLITSPFMAQNGTIITTPGY